MKSFTVSTDANLDIDFLHVTQNPTIRGIEIISSLPQADLAELAGVWAFDFGANSSPDFLSLDLAGAAAVLAADNPLVQGIVPRVTWAQLQTGPNTYNWTVLDRIFEVADTYDKRVAIRIVGGRNLEFSPDFVWNSVSNYVDVYNPIWDTNLRLPQLGDPSFDLQWQNFITAVGARYADNPRLQRVHITPGLDQEMYYLPIAMTQQQTDQLWPDGVQAGIDGMLQAWSDAVATYKTAFARSPGSGLSPVAFALEISEPILNLSGIDNQGLVESIVSDAIAQLGDRLYVQQDGLNEPASPCPRSPLRRNR